jgi:hypothetical protein
METKVDQPIAIIDEATRRETEEPLLVWAEKRRLNEEPVVPTLQQA